MAPNPKVEKKLCITYEKAAIKCILNVGEIPTEVNFINILSAAFPFAKNTSVGGPRYLRVCYSRFQLSAAYDLCTEFVIHGYFP